jgi:hypothetical protein
MGDDSMCEESMHSPHAHTHIEAFSGSLVKNVQGCLKHVFPSKTKVDAKLFSATDSSLPTNSRRLSSADCGL